MSKVTNIEKVGSWNRVLNAARNTVSKEPLDKEPSDSFKRKILLAEHSPIRLLEYDITIEDLPSWVSVHFARHHEGVEKFVSTQRDDRTDKPVSRADMPQSTPVKMILSCNAQALINISRKRLCACASPETRETWKQVLSSLKAIDPILVEKCRRECVYRGFCPEMSCCGYVNTETYKQELEEYHKI